MHLGPLMFGILFILTNLLFANFLHDRDDISSLRNIRKTENE